MSLTPGLQFSSDTGYPRCFWKIHWVPSWKSLILSKLELVPGHLPFHNLSTFSSFTGFGDVVTELSEVTEALSHRGL